MAGDNTKTLLERLIVSLEAAECLSPAECHDVASGSFDDVQTDEVAAHVRACADCRKRLEDANDSEQRNLNRVLTTLDQPANRVALPERLMKVLTANDGKPGFADDLSWPNWCSRVEHWLQPVPAGVGTLAVAARGISANGSYAPFGKEAVMVVCSGMRFRVQAIVAAAPLQDLWVELLDASGGPMAGRELELWSEGAITSEVRRTSPRGTAVFRNERGGRHLLRIHRSDVVGIDLTSAGRTR